LTNHPEDYWDQVAEQWRDAQPQHLWRTYSDKINCALLDAWLSTKPVECLLKTDLFDEASTEGLYPLLAARSHHVVGMDISGLIGSTAWGRHPALLTICADVRRLPFQDNAFDVVVSPSTLDHFDSTDQIVVGLIELRRVLKPGGMLILTLDNLANPIIALRSILPFRLLNALGILPYAVGATMGPRRLNRSLRSAGFDVQETSAVIHCPRVFAVALASFLEKHTSPKTQSRFLRLLSGFEGLARWPTRFITGHFVAVKATKPCERTV
jgi:SAM-dependent methyltransferase